VRYIVFLSLFLLSVLQSFELQKAQRYNDENISGWYISEKLDGIRAYWDGKKLYTRKGLEISAPAWFTKELPSFALDGELWTQRGAFEEIQSIVLRDQPDERWRKIKYMVFEVPNAKGDFMTRLLQLKKYLQQKQNIKHLKLIEQKLCTNTKDLELFVEQVLRLGGEGAMLKDATLEYWSGRSSGMYKVKKAQDSEAVVIGYKEGKGKFQGVLGSLHLRTFNGVEFYLGSGFSKEQRKNPPSLGDVVTFKHYGYTKNGKPKFASFMRIRKD